MVSVVNSAQSKQIRSKQDKILDVAAELFLERGYDAVSLDDILERAGGSKTTIYSYYGGKEGLFAAMVERLAVLKLRLFRDLDPARLDPKTGLNAIGRRFMTLINDSEGRAFYRMMIAEAERFPALARTFYESSPAVIISEVRRNLEHWQEKGLLREGNAELMAIQFIGMLLGTFSTKSLLGIAPVLTEKQIREWVSKGVTMFLEGAIPRGAA
jgi:AcrR family transcriptional regulator